MFALILTLCSFASCNGYVIATDDNWTTKDDCLDQLSSERSELAGVWGKDGIQDYLDRFNVQEDVSTLSGYKFTCVRIGSNDDKQMLPERNVLPEREEDE